MQKALQEKIFVVRKNFAEQLPRKIDKVEKTWKLLEQGSWKKDQFQLFFHMIHTISGSSGTMGFPEIGSSASQLENLIKPLMDSGEQATIEQKELINNRLVQLVKTTKVALKKGTVLPHSSLILQPPSVISELEKKLIFLVEDDTDLSSEIASQLVYYGYQTKSFATLRELRLALEETEPVMIIMDIQLPDGNGCNTMADIQKGRKTPLPVLFMSKDGDLQSRLKSVKVGGEGFFHKPISITELIDSLDNILNVHDDEAYRILIVEDSESLLNHFSLVLEHAGMKTAKVSEPLKVMEPLEDFRPDLILMDLYMPGCTGIELAKVIRQQHTYISIPIVFLSGETDIGKQLAALNFGGDDFLTKPIESEHLVQSVTSRAKRSRILRGQMIRDGLTGLYNHSSTKEQLVFEVERAKRNKTLLAFAMLDIDKFKMVNDNYGHPTGDKVIKSLARLLKQRLRKTDIVGRYGGEEFAVIMPDTDALNAERILNELRIVFSKIQHQYQDVLFNKTFSCGIAIFPENNSGSDLNNMADEALYLAKNSGRNQVVVWTEKRGRS